MTINELIMSLELGIIYGIVAIGIWVTFRIIDFSDLTCDGSFVLGAVVAGGLIRANYNPWFALLAALVSGALAGSFTGILSTKFKVTSLLSGILVAFMLYSVNLRIMHGTPNIALLDMPTIFPAAKTLVILAVLGIMTCGLIKLILVTDFGLALRSIGQNKRLSLQAGVNVPLMTMVGLSLSNSLIALGGALFSQHQGFADVSSGSGTVIIGLASVMIGERILPYKSIIIQLISCLLGSILYRILISLALYSEVLGLYTQDLNLITGVMVIIIMATQKRYYVRA